MEKKQVLIDFLKWYDKQPNKELVRIPILVNKYLKSMNAEVKIQGKVNKICRYIQKCSHQIIVKGKNHCDCNVMGCKFYGRKKKE